MAKKDKKVSKIKIKKKNWYKVLAPKMFGSKEIGESYLSSPDKAVGRSLTVNLKELTGNIKDQHAQVSFKISKVDGSVLQTKTTGFMLTSAYIKRLVRKNTTRLDDYLVLKTKDNQEVIIKPICIALHKTQRSIRTELRKQIAMAFKEELSKVDFDTFVLNVVNRKILFNVKKRLHKVFPVKEVSIRVLVLKDSKGRKEAEVEIEAGSKAGEGHQVEKEEVAVEVQEVEEFPEDESAEEESLEENTEALFEEEKEE